jgi:hypothetical protein
MRQLTTFNFANSRKLQALEALMRKETFLSNPEWREIPFSETELTPLDKLLDQILEAPAIMSLADELEKMKSPEEVLGKAVEIGKLCWKLDSNLQEFYDEIEASANGPMYWPLFATARVVAEDEQDEPNLFPVHYQFPDFRIATTLIFYWSTQLLLYSGMCHLYQLYDELGQAAKASEDGSPSATPPEDFVQSLGLGQLEHRTDFLTPARHVCQSVEYCLADDLGFSVLLGPLNIVINIMVEWPGHEREVKWAKDSLERLRRRGLEIVRFLPRHVDIDGHKEVRWR